MRLILAACLVVGCGGAAAAPRMADATTRYPIHLSRSYVVGQRWGEETRYEENGQRLFRDGAGAVIQDVRTRRVIELSGEYTVLSLDPTRLRLSIARYTVDTGEGPTRPAVPAVVVLDRTGSGSIATEHGEPLDPSLVALLRPVVPLAHLGVSDDDAFGTEEPHAVGESWPLDAADVARGIRNAGLIVEETSVGGDTTLVGIDAIEGQGVLVLRTVLSAHDFRLADLPAGSAMRRADALLRMDISLPTDVTQQALRESAQTGIDIQMEITGQAGPQLLDGSFQQQMTRTRTPHPPL
jgi:hypothetical protein